MSWRGHQRPSQCRWNCWMDQRLWKGSVTLHRPGNFGSACLCEWCIGGWLSMPLWVVYWGGGSACLCEWCIGGGSACLCEWHIKEVTQNASMSGGCIGEWLNMPEWVVYWGSDSECVCEWCMGTVSTADWRLNIGWFDFQRTFKIDLMYCGLAIYCQSNVDSTNLITQGRPLHHLWCYYQLYPWHDFDDLGMI